VVHQIGSVALACTLAGVLPPLAIGIVVWFSRGPASRICRLAIENGQPEAQRRMVDPLKKKRLTGRSIDVP